jgi:hypothetical protein
MAFDINKSKERTTNGSPFLRNIKDLFHSQDAVKSTFSDPDKVAIVRINLGEIVTAAASCIQFSDRPNGRRNLVIRRKALYQPTIPTNMDRPKTDANMQAKDGQRCRSQVFHPKQLVLLNVYFIFSESHESWINTTIAPSGPRESSMIAPKS